GISGDAALLGHFSDGVILVLKANSTRRIAAQKTRQMLRAANAALLGVVLDQRRFPIPTGIYNKLVTKSASFEDGVFSNSENERKAVGKSAKTWVGVN